MTDENSHNGANRWQYHPSIKSYTTPLKNKRFAVFSRKEGVVSLEIDEYHFYPNREVSEEIARLDFNTDNGKYFVRGRGVLENITHSLVLRNGMGPESRASLKGIISDFEAGVAR